MRHFIIALLALTACPSSDEPAESCVMLQDYYDDCCTECGEQDSFCSANDLDATEFACDQELEAFGDLDQCACDGDM